MINAPTRHSTTDTVTAHHSDHSTPRRARQPGRWRELLQISIANFQKKFNAI